MQIIDYRFAWLVFLAGACLGAAWGYLCALQRRSIVEIVLGVFVVGGLFFVAVLP